MTFGAQPDRFVSSHAADAEQKQPETLEPPAEYAAKERALPLDNGEVVARPTNPFEGFGSFA